MRIGLPDKNDILRIRKMLFVATLVALLVSGCLLCILDNSRYEVRIIASGSMDAGPQDHPIGSIPMGSLVIIDRDSDYGIGDVIAFTYRMDGRDTVLVHRVLRMGDMVTTHGDANPETAVEFVGYDDVIGKVIAVNHPVGNAVWFIRTNIPGFTAISVIILFMSWALSNIIKEIKKGDE